MEGEIERKSSADGKQKGAVALTPENGEMQQPACFSEPTAVLFLLYQRSRFSKLNPKGPKRGTPSVSRVFRGRRVRAPRESRDLGSGRCSSSQSELQHPHHLLKKVDENFWDYLRQALSRPIDASGGEDADPKAAAASIHFDVEDEFFAESFPVADNKRDRRA